MTDTTDFDIDRLRELRGVVERRELTDEEKDEVNEMMNEFWINLHPIVEMIADD